MRAVVRPDDLLNIFGIKTPKLLEGLQYEGQLHVLAKGNGRDGIDVRNTVLSGTDVAELLQHKPGSHDGLPA